MKPGIRGRSKQAFALVVVLAFTGISFIILTGALGWSANNSNHTDRNNQYFRTVAAAEAATEKVLAHMVNEYDVVGELISLPELDRYRDMVPKSAEHTTWQQFQFDDGEGNHNKTYVEKIVEPVYKLLNSQYVGLYGMASVYEVLSYARQHTGIHRVRSGIRQEVEIASIPIFQFVMFYAHDLEIHPGDHMVIPGRVHSNRDIFCQPGLSTHYTSHLTAAGKIYQHKKPDDPVERTNGDVIYDGYHDSGVASLNLSIGASNSPAALHELIEIPPGTEDPTSPMGRHRYYNMAELIILVSNTTVTATSGSYNNFSTTIPYEVIDDFLTTNVMFFNKREAKDIQTTQIDLSAFRSEYSDLTDLLGKPVKVLYVADLRTQAANTQSGVRLVSGQELPAGGLTVATLNPLYVKGNYNVPDAYLGSTNTSQSKPAALIGDAVTLLSGDWDDANSTGPLGNRQASSTTLNAAVIAGIVPTGGGYYSGGIENMIRFLENWSGDTFTFNGSLVSLFYSEIATGPWRGGGATVGVYNAPKRDWHRDPNFDTFNKLPAGTPMIRGVVRGSWELLGPGASGG